MQTITDWTARRSGARITVTGKTPDGRPCKVSVDQIHPSQCGTIAAQDQTGEQYLLAEGRKA